MRVPEIPNRVPPFRILRDVGGRDYPEPRQTTYAVQTEPLVFAINRMLLKERHQGRPMRLGKQALLYIAHRGSDQELREQKWLGEEIRLASESGKAVFTCDVRGIGESLPNTCGVDTFDSPYGCDYFYAIHSLMLDRPYLGQKVFDVLRTIQWMQSFWLRRDFSGRLSLGRFDCDLRGLAERGRPRHSNLRATRVLSPACDPGRLQHAAGLLASQRDRAF